MSTDQGKEGDIAIRFSLATLLSRLREQERTKPPAQQQQVPTFSALAETVGISRVMMWKFTKRNVKLINLKHVSAMYNELRRRGFEVEIADLFTEHPIDMT